MEDVQNTVLLVVCRIILRNYSLASLALYDKEVTLAHSISLVYDNSAVYCLNHMLHFRNSLTKLCAGDTSLKEYTT